MTENEKAIERNNLKAKQREWQNNRKRQIRRRVLMGAVGVATLAALIGGVKAGIDYDKNHLSLSEVDYEIKVHSGNYLSDDGHPITPFMNHGCSVPNDGETPFEERLANRMIEEGYDSKTVEAAEDKFNYYCNNEHKLAKEINLKEIEKEAKEAKRKGI